MILYLTTGPVAPAGGPSGPEPGSAHWVKGDTPPGGAAAAEGGTAAATGSKPSQPAGPSTVTSEGKMHIGECGRPGCRTEAAATAVPFCKSLYGTTASLAVTDCRQMICLLGKITAT